ncbi:hypothetical protein [Collimonas arenae]|nr:hypothetical protein [Collimonas arenae]
MKNYDLEATLARHEALMRKILGPEKRENRHSTMEEDAAYDRDCEERREFREWVLQMKAQNWLINGVPIVL